jgi:uncharacterized SAM-binding protein YcdF (DUF218 family)
MTPPALVVLGSSIERTCRLLAAEAARSAERLDAELVVLTGWSGEGERMRAAWRGSSKVELVVEGTASTTAENAARTLPLLIERGVSEAVVICAPLHLWRARMIFRRVYGQRGIAVRFRAARVAPTPGAVLWELAALTVLGRQVRAAKAELKRG